MTCILTSMCMTSEYAHTSEDAKLYHGDVHDVYKEWDAPTVIISDGAYGVGSFDGDPRSVAGLVDWYKPHIEAWSNAATAETTLWFWGTELGWATVHHELLNAGWKYRGCNIWNKGIQHIAGNVNSNTMRKFPQVTEVCVQYVWEQIQLTDEAKSVREWFRDEWERAGLTFQEANDACNVSEAASRKYFASDEQWYPPPDDKFNQLREYANEHGNPDGKPYFVLPDKYDTDTMQRATPAAKFDLPIGVTNVWDEPPVNQKERFYDEDGAIHPNQKPVSLMERIITVSSEPNDIVWEPFGGLCTGGVAAVQNKRRARIAEINDDYVMIGQSRLQTAKKKQTAPSQSKLNGF